MSVNYKNVEDFLYNAFYYSEVDNYMIKLSGDAGYYDISILNEDTLERVFEKEYSDLFVAVETLKKIEDGDIEEFLNSNSVDESVKVLKKQGYKVIKEDLSEDDLEDIARSNRNKTWRSKREGKHFTGLELPNDDFEEMTFDEYFATVNQKIDRMCKLYNVKNIINRSEVKELFDDGVSVKDAFKTLWTEIID